MKDVASLPPLQLPEASASSSAQGGAKARKVCSYKEMWKKENAKASLSRSSLYEAGGSGFWLSCNPDDVLNDSASMPIHVGSWNQLLQAKALFNPSKQHGRVLWPVTMECLVRSADDVSQGDQDYPRSLKLICDHLVLAAWWACMYDAMQNHEQDRVVQLFECILTVTIRVSLFESDAQVMRVAIQASERTRTLECTVDNILVFSDRLGIILKDVPEDWSQAKMVEQLKADGVMFQGKLVTRNLLVACEAMRKHLTNRSKNILNYMESKYGRSLLTDGPTKLYRVIVMCSKYVSSLQRVSPKPSSQDALEMVLALLASSLGTDSMQADSCTSDFLTGKETKTSGEQQCWCAVALVAVGLGQHAINLVNLLDCDQCPGELKLVMNVLLNPVLWRQELQKQAKMEGKALRVRGSFY